MSEFYKMAINNISRKGDTDIFPFPVENYLFYDRSGDIENILLDLDRNYEKHLNTSPVDCIKTCIPVGYTGFRWAAMIDPVWNAFLLGESLKISEQIESKRIPAEENYVFSYRLKYDEESGSLFNREVNWKAFNKKAGEIADDYKYIITFDISDFYNRIYHERLRNVLHTDVAAEGKSVDRIMGILSGISGGSDPYGLPVGGNAARILAEALLIRSDNFMKEKGIRFCRFVDDYVVFADSVGNAYNLLNLCADYFLRSMGLTLQKNKTAIMTQSEFKRHIKTVFDEIEGTNDTVRTSLMKLNLSLDPYSATADETLRNLKDQIDGSGVINLLKSEIRKTKINQMFGNQLLKAVQFVEEKHLSEAFDVLSLNFDKFYPVFPVVMRTASRNLQKCSEQTITDFLDRISDLFENNSYIIQTENNASYAIRVLSLFRNDRGAKTIAGLYELCSTGDKHSSSLVRQNAVYCMANQRNAGWIRERLTSFPHLSRWERRSVVAAAAFLQEEGETWRKTFSEFCSPLENLVGDWSSEQLHSKPNWRLPL